MCRNTLSFRNKPAAATNLAATSAAKSNSAICEFKVPSLRRSGGRLNASVVSARSVSASRPLVHDGRSVLGSVRYSDPNRDCSDRSSSLEIEMSLFLFRRGFGSLHLNPTVAKFVTVGFCLAPQLRHRQFRRDIASLRNALRHALAAALSFPFSKRDTSPRLATPDPTRRAPKLSVSDQRQPVRVNGWVRTAIAVSGFPIEVRKLNRPVMVTRTSEKRVA